MRIGDLVARIVTQRRAYVWLGVIAGAIVCLIIFVSRISLDSEVLNMLPGKFSSVEGLKIYDRAFEQTRELTFALHCQPDDVDKLEEFAPIFAEHLRKQPWCERVLAGSPMQTPDGIRDLQSIAVPLLLNLEPPAFEETISILQPEKLRERLHRFREQIEAGSPRAQFQLEFDPLGLIGPALKPFAESNQIEEEQPLASSDRTMRVFLVVTNQPSISAFECQRVMRQVNAFRAHARDGWEGGPLDVLVTGRSAYVAEISLSMQHDIIATVIGSVVLVGIIFFAGFGRWMPLLGMGFSLLLSCLFALALGLLIFGRLNMVTVGFCAILVGLGVDFAILIFGRYQQARTDGESHPQAISTAIQKLGRSVFFGALTTAVGFLALVLSGSIGFSQLGVLIAIGILFAGLFMCTILFLFVGEGQAPARHDWIFEAVRKYVAWSVRRPAAILILATVILSSLTVFGFSPKPPLPFDASATFARTEKEPCRSGAGRDYEQYARCAGNRCWSSCAHLTRSGSTTIGKKSRRIGASCKRRARSKAFPRPRRWRPRQCRSNTIGTGCARSTSKVCGEHWTKRSMPRDSVPIRFPARTSCSTIYSRLPTQTRRYRTGETNFRNLRAGGSWSIATSRKIPCSPSVLLPVTNQSKTTRSPLRSAANCRCRACR